MSAGKTDISEIVINTTAIAKMFNLTERRVRQLVEEGVISRVWDGCFDLIDTVSKYFTFLKLSAEGIGEKWLHEKVKREKAEIELAHIKKEMHCSEEVEKVLNHMVMAFRSKALSLPTKVALMLINRDDPKHIEALLEQNIHETLQELASYDPSMFVEIIENEVVEVVEYDTKENAKVVSKES
ncbi:hypothetical protein ACIQZG_24360 [Lysinibacillus sp. NPDC096418]|uniref:hypothetical protein n=1 Tax=Lysinibacillus sp. NPDC096418 TaxID=3364138 RepID=UPI0037F12F5C